MRSNLPVTLQEQVLHDGRTIVSTTDLKGRIQYANPYFVEISGFTEEELLGAPQNILRHPDMPVEAFADMWNTIKAGMPWTGMVKNRCKNGDYYWVQANVTPVIENGAMVGYMSVRTKPACAQIEQAEQLYSEIRNGNPQRLRLVHGRVVRPGLHALVTALRNVRLSRLIALTQGVSILALAAMLTGSIWREGWDAMALFGVLAIAGAVLSWRLLHQSVVAPLHQATRFARQMAGGDLTGDIHQTHDNDMGQLLAALRQSSVNLHSIIGDVRGNFQEIRTATSEIASGNMDLSGRTESQASSLQQTAASMEQLASNVQQSAGNVANANELASQAAQVAAEGGNIVGQVVHTMDEINTSSRRILDIIGMIDGIAFQTNILALNAAVEAARAGEHGRGFAVVATEVRSLAQHSAAAAREVKQLIDVSLAKIAAGTTLSGNAGHTMEQVIQSVRRVTSVMDEISTATSEQTRGIGQVNEAVTHIDDMTQQNAALVEQAAAAAGNLARQADGLAQAMAIFKLGDQPGAVRKPDTSLRLTA
ncbi:MAG: PAS domain-containing protein [Burkholderiaceae bacterium]|nr:PAS domain-containing protein [Burkholderiaceae bacterium]